MADYLQYIENEDTTQLPDLDTAPGDGSEDNGVDIDTTPNPEDSDKDEDNNTGGEIYPPEPEPSPPPTPEPPYFIVATTLRGFAYLAKQQADKAEPNITRIVAGTGYVHHSMDVLERQTDVQNPITAEIEIGPRELVDKHVCRIPYRLSSESMNETALIRQIGVYSEDDEGEFLCQILQYAHPQPLPSVKANMGAIAILEGDIDMVFANAELAEIPTSPGWFLSQSDMSTHDTDPGAHQGQFTTLSGMMAEIDQTHAAWQQRQDTEIKLLKDTMITDISENKRIIVFVNLDGVRLVQGVFNTAFCRIEC